MEKNIVAEVVIKNKNLIIKTNTLTETVNIPDSMDKVNFIAYSISELPITNPKKCELSIKWDDMKLVSKNCNCVFFKRIKETFSKRLLKDIKKYGMPLESLKSPIFEYRLRFESDKKHTKFSWR